MVSSGVLHVSERLVTDTPGPASLGPRLYELEAAVRARSAIVPQVAMVLGSGLGGIADLVEDPVAIPFAQLPGWPAASAPGHAGRLLLGRLEGVPVACLQGRLHMYEGLDALKVAEPALLMGRLGARVLVLTNASGGVDPRYEAGTLMLLTDHLNLTGRSPLHGPNDDDLGPRFLDLTTVYDTELRARVRASASAEGVPLEEGVYAGLLGPTFETPAEVRMLGVLGANAVGMSTVMEAIAARWVGMRVVALSLVTNKGAGLSPTPLSHDEVLAAANEAGPRLARVLARFVRELPADL
jgi:inosine/guanosine/xanthosine phosphorylase family protein